MEINELNKKIINNVRSKVVVSNLEREEKMKINKKKQIISMAAVLMIFLLGGFATVNAATKGQLTQKIKDTITVTLIKEGDGTYQMLYNDENQEKLDENDMTYVTYNITTETGEGDLSNYTVKREITESDIEGERYTLDGPIIINYETK